MIGLATFSSLFASIQSSIASIFILLLFCVLDNWLAMCLCCRSILPKGIDIDRASHPYQCTKSFRTFSLNDSGSRISPDNVNKSYLFNHQSKLHIDHNCRQRRWIERNNDAINRSSHIRTFVQNNNPHQTKRAKHLPYPHLPSTFFLSSSTQLAIILFVLFNCLIHCPFSSGKCRTYFFSPIFMQ